MSTKRVAEAAGWVDPKKMEKGPNGRNLCRWCKQEVPKGRRTFCSQVCIQEHRIRTDPGYVRQLVQDRDGGVCAMCGVDTAARYRRLLPRYHDFSRKCFQRFLAKQMANWEAWDRSRVRLKVWVRRVGFTLGHQWEADHITPVCEGGGECGLENYRTLCIRCHRKVTRELRGRRSKKAKAWA